MPAVARDADQFAACRRSALYKASFSLHSRAHGTTSTGQVVPTYAAATGWTGGAVGAPGGRRRARIWANPKRAGSARPQVETTALGAKHPRNAAP